MINPILLNQYQMAASDEVARANRMAQAWRFYHGQHPKSLKVRPGQPDDNVEANYARIIIDTGVSFLFGADIGFELDDDETTPIEEWLSKCWRQNRQMTTLHKLGVNGAVAGHAFVKIVDSKPFPRIIVLDPATVKPTWDSDDIETVTAYKIQYNSIDPKTSKPLVKRQLIEQDGQVWRITDQVSTGDSVVWQTVSEAVWPHPWAPVVDCQNLPCPNEFWGISDLEDDVLGLNKSINFILTNLNRIIRFHAHPKTWGKGFTANQLNIAVDETIVLPSPDATLQNLEMFSDLGSSIQFYQRLREALHEITRVPEVAAGHLENVGQLSGLALKVLYGPLVDKTQTKQQTYGEMLTELNRRLLALGGFGEDNYTVTHWPELVPSDPLQERQALLIDEQLGVSQDTLMTKLGYDPDLEKQKSQAASADLGDQMLTSFESGQGDG